jgi:O-antigen ligase
MECIVKIMIFLLPLLIASLSINISKEQIYYLIKLFVLTGIISGLMVVIQYCFYISSIKIDLGHQTEFLRRTAFAGLFYDYSIMSVYMSAISGMLFIGIFLHKCVFNRIIDFLLVIFFICASTITSARTGIIAFLIVLFLFFLLEKKKSNIILFLILSVPLFYLGFHILSLNRNIVLLDDNGRWNVYLLAFDFFEKNPIWGSGGLGYVAMTNNMGPHNFILDFLVDFGLIVTIFLLILFGTIFYNGLKIHSILSYLLLSFLVGGLFHASLINTHYIMIPSILIVSYKSSS